MGKKIVSCAQMKAAEKYVIDSGISSLRLMENAGSAAARFIRETAPLSGARCTVICGSGNNGGDGFVVARRLYGIYATITVVLACGPSRTPEATEMSERLNTLGIPVIDYALNAGKALREISRSDIVVDAVFGTGFHGKVDDPTARLFQAVNMCGAKIFALDMPSGANADTGEASEPCINAACTVTFAAAKTGHFLFPAAEFCGRIIVVNIGISDEAFSGEPVAELLDCGMVRDAVPRRVKNSNKGTYGRALCICGSLGMSGAAYMSATSAARCGAGIVSVAVPKSIYPVIAEKVSEVMALPLAETSEGTLSASNLDHILNLAQKATAVLIGCGLSMNAETAALVREFIKMDDGTIVLDADGINAFSGHINLLRESKAKLILTPHPGEMARLTGLPVERIQADRVGIASSFAAQTGVTLVLKGSNTVIAAGRGNVYLNPTGNPGMAKGGSGDILAGMITGFAAQGFSSAAAACCGAFIHGLAGDRCAEKLSEYGMLPTDMLLEIPQIFRDMSR